MTLTTPAKAHVSLFTGLGGWEYALQLADIPHRTVLYCEINPYRQEVIRQRIRDGIFHDAPIWPDVRTLDGRPFAGRVGILTASFVCKMFSTAGKRLGARDARNTWPDTARLIAEMEPRVILLENVPGLLWPIRGGEPYVLTVLGDLARLGYVGWGGVISARDVGGSQERARWWAVAYSRCGGGDGLQPEFWLERSKAAPTGSNGESMEHSVFTRLAGWGRPFGEGTDGWPTWPPGPEEQDRWAEISGRWPHFEPAICRVADGIPHRRQRLEALGDGLVPAVAAEFLRRIIT